MKIRKAAYLLISSFLLTLNVSGETYTTWCASHFTALELQAGLAIATGDADHDGETNLIEYFGGSNPRLGSSLFHAIPSYDLGIAQGLVSVAVPQDRVDLKYEIELSNTLLTWAGGAVLVSGPSPDIWRMGGDRFARVRVGPKDGFVLDSDADGIDDRIEQLWIDSNLTDVFVTLGDIRPGDDFDGDGIKNLDEGRYELNGLADDPANTAGHVQYTYDFDALIGANFQVGPPLSWDYDKNLNPETISE